MFPLRDSVPSASPPVVTVALIAINVIVYFYQAGMAHLDELRLMSRYALTPYKASSGEFVHPLLVEYLIEFRVYVEQRRMKLKPSATWRDVRDSKEFQSWLYTTHHRFVTDFPARSISATERWLPFLTCMFLHGSWMHLIGNMWFLWIFGDNVEDALGKGRFVLFYLLTGLAGGIGHVITGPDSPLPTVGASGAVAGVMGAYMLMFPQARVIALVPILMVANLMEVPAAAFLGIWVLFQLASAAVARESLGGGTAWMAHVGGFAAGAAWALLMPKAHDEHSWVDRRRKQWRGW